MKNLVITAACGLEVEKVEFFLKSLRNYYNEEIFFLIGKQDSKIKELLKIYNCSFLEVSVHKTEIQLKRYQFFLEFLKEKEYKNVLFCDSRDIYFQSNPFDFNYGGSINFFLEDKEINNCPYNSNWIIKTYGAAAYKEVSKKIILCSGTVLGSLEKMREYLTLMKDKILKIKYRKSLKYLLTFRRDPEGRGCDQGHANYLVNKQYINECFFYSNAEGPIATVFYLKKLHFDKQLRLLNIYNKPYSVVHQYDKRWDEFSFTVNKIKESLNIK